MPFVLDASTTASWAFEDEDHPYADEALLQIHQDQAFVPALWWFEVRNILIINERRKRSTALNTAAHLQDLSEMAIIQDITPDEVEILRLARQHRLTVYDAAYLELAIRNNIPLATLDIELIRAANAEGVPIVGKNS
jgi:predicted nucleic acid-binding protein